MSASDNFKIDRKEFIKRQETAVNDLMGEIFKVCNGKEGMSVLISLVQITEFFKRRIMKHEPITVGRVVDTFSAKEVIDNLEKRLEPHIEEIVVKAQFGKE